MYCAISHDIVNYRKLLYIIVSYRRLSVTHIYFCILPLQHHLYKLN